MPPPSYTLYTPEASFRAFATLIAAEYNGINVDINTDQNEAQKKSPINKSFVLQQNSDTATTTNSSTIFSSHAAARYVAGLRKDTGLLGATGTDAAAIDAWCDWASSDLEIPSIVWWYPVAGYMPFHPAAYQKAKTDLSNALQVLELHLQDKAYLVGKQVTLADIAIVSILLYPFKLVCDGTYLQKFPKVVQWFQGCVGQPEFQQVLGQVTMCQKELVPSTPTAAPSDKQ